MDELEAGAELVRRVSAELPVEAAFWLKPSDDDESTLHFVMSHVTDANFGDAYGKVWHLARAMDSVHLDPFCVKVLGRDSPLARAALKMLNRSTGRSIIRIGSQMFGDTFVEGGYLYPRPQPAAAPTA